MSAIGRASGHALATHVLVALAFATMALAGALFALAGPVAFVRVLGTVALCAGALGAALQLYLLHRYHAAQWRVLRMRMQAWQRRFSQRVVEPVSSHCVPMAEPAAA